MKLHLSLNKNTDPPRKPSMTETEKQRCKIRYSTWYGFLCNKEITDTPSNQKHHQLDLRKTKFNLGKAPFWASWEKKKRQTLLTTAWGGQLKNIRVCTLWWVVQGLATESVRRFVQYRATCWLLLSDDDYTAFEQHPAITYWLWHSLSTPSLLCYNNTN